MCLQALAASGAVTATCQFSLYRIGRGERSVGSDAVGVLHLLITRRV